MYVLFRFIMSGTKYQIFLFSTCRKATAAQSPVMTECTRLVATFLHFHLCWALWEAEGGTREAVRRLVRAKVTVPQMTEQMTDISGVSEAGQGAGSRAGTTPP